MSTNLCQSPAPGTTMKLIAAAKSLPVRCQPWRLQGDGHPHRWHVADPGWRTQTRAFDLLAAASSKANI